MLFCERVWPLACGVRTHLGANEQVRNAGRILLQLGHPFLAHILETGGVYHREADEEDVGHGVGERPETVVVLLDEHKYVRINNEGEGRDGGDEVINFHILELITRERLKNVKNELQTQTHSVLCASGAKHRNARHENVHSELIYTEITATFTWELLSPSLSHPDRGY